MSMKPTPSKSETGIRSRFDFSRATRGRFADRYNVDATVSLLDGDPDMEDPLDMCESHTSTRDAGKRIFVSQVEAAGLKIAEPLRDENVDYLIYWIGQENQNMLSCAVKVKASTHKYFSLSKTDLRSPHSLLAYVWQADSPENSRIYALSYQEALQILENKGFTKTDAWTVLGGYSRTHVGPELEEMLESYRMTPERWHQRLNIH